MAKKIITLIFLLVMILQVSVIAQDKWQTYTSNLSILCLEQEENYIWVGTSEGLVRINKITKEHEIYNSNNSGIPNNTITCIAIGENNEKWIGTRSGLVKYNDSEWFTYDELNLQNNNIYCLIYERGVGLWIGEGYNNTTNDFDGLTLFDGKNKLHFNSENSDLPDNIVYSIAIDTAGNKWIGTFSGLAKFDNENWIVYHQDNSKLPHDMVKTISIDSLGNKWIGGAEYITKFDGENWTFWISRPAEDYIWNITCGIDGKIWTGHFSDGLSVYDGNVWKGYRPDNSGIPNYEVTAILVDETNTKWIGTLGGGLVRFNNDNWIVQKTGNSEITQNSIKSMLWDGSKNIWIGYTDGLTKFDGNIWKNYNLENTGIKGFSGSNIVKDNNNNIWTNLGNIGLARYNGIEWEYYQFKDSNINYFSFAKFDIDRDNIIWIATSNYGIITFDGINWELFDQSNSSIPSNKIKSIAIDENNVKWIGIYEGLFKYNGNNWEKVLDWNTDEIIIEKDGTFWLKSINDGIAKFDGNTTTYFSHSNSDLPGKYVYKIFIDKFGNLWAGTDNGLAKYDGGNWEIFNVENSGLLSNSICSITEDANNNMWIGTSSGIAVYNETGIVSAEDHILSNGGEISENFYLSQNYPNPFNPTTKITYKLPEAGEVEIKVYDLRGRLVSNLLKGYKEAGTHTITFDGKNIASGIYFYSVNVNGVQETKKMMLVK